MTHLCSLVPRPFFQLKEGLWTRQILYNNIRQAAANLCLVLASYPGVPGVWYVRSEYDFPSIYLPRWSIEIPMFRHGVHSPCSQLPPRPPFVAAAAFSRYRRSSDFCGEGRRSWRRDVQPMAHGPAYIVYVCDVHSHIHAAVYAYGSGGLFLINAHKNANYCIPRGHCSATVSTRPFLAFCNLRRI
jgi:hypothetical protein